VKPNTTSGGVSLKVRSRVADSKSHSILL
jgi:hypothetical protein